MSVQEGKFRPAFVSSLILHVGVLLLLIINFEFSGHMIVTENVNNNAKIISAVAINMPPVPEVESNPPPPPTPVKQEQPVKPVVTRPPVPPQPTQAQKLQELEQQMQKQQAIAINELRQKRLQEQKTLLAKKLLLQKKQQADKAKLVKQQKALETAMEKELKEQASKSLQQQLMSEQKRAAGAKSQGEVNKFKALILQAIGRRWLVPSGVDKSLSSELLIRLAPGGAVLDVQVTKSSGSVALDRSARDAVFKASPLPVPESDAFDQFRQFVLKVKPENVIAHDIG